MNLDAFVTQKIANGTLEPSTFRSNIAAHLHRVMETNDDTEARVPVDGSYSRNLERGVFNASLVKCDKLGVPKLWKNEMFVEIYLRTLHYVLYALEYAHIRAGITDKTIRPHTIPFMTHQEIFPEKWTSLLDNKVKREQNMFKSNVQASTDSYTCRRCKSKECTFYQMQTRSADEPMTIFISCISCGNQWKQ